jgi:hypothetical protein
MGTHMSEFQEHVPDHHIEILALYELQHDGRRAFDATDGIQVIAGVASHDPDGFDQPRTYVYVDREDPLGDSYAVKIGTPEELSDDVTFSALIVGALRHMPLPGHRARYFTAQGIIDPTLN